MDELEVAEKAARKAGSVHLKHFRKDHKSERKKDKSLLTQTDTESDEVIIEVLKNNFPEYNFLGEECGFVDNDSDLTWMIDPLDGTANFARGDREFCSVVSLVKDKEAVLSAMYFSVYDELYKAVKGEGAWRDGEKLSVSSKNDISEMDAVSHMPTHEDERPPNLEIYNKIVSEVNRVEIPRTCIIRSLAKLAEGSMDFCFRTCMDYWDTGAGALLVEEAGGVATDFNGETFNLDSENYLISNGVCHESLLDLINS